MTYSVWCQGVMIGRSDLAARSPGPNARTGRLDTTPEFGQVWPNVEPVVAEWMAAAMALGNLAAELPPAADGEDPLEYGRQVHERLKDLPQAARVRAAAAAVASLGFELRDDADNHVATKSVIVQEVKFPDFIPQEVLACNLEEARQQGHDVSFPLYIVNVFMAS